MTDYFEREIAKDLSKGEVGKYPELKALVESKTAGKPIAEDKQFITKNTPFSLVTGIGGETTQTAGPNKHGYTRQEYADK